MIDNKNSVHIISFSVHTSDSIIELNAPSLNAK